MDNFVEVSVPATGETEEALCDFLFSEGALGLVTEEVPGEPLQITIRASFAGSVAAGPMLDRLRRYQAALEALGFVGARGAIAVRDVPVEDWGRNWKKHFKPLPVGRRLVIAPPWETGPFSEGRRLIVIDPAMAFGTGHHATTRMCLENLELLMDARPAGRGPLVLDVGTGTGILAIAAASLGARRVIAIDTDPQACDAASKNLGRCDRRDRVELVCGGIEAFDPRLRCDLILANLDTRTLCPLFPTLASRLAQGGRIIVGGIAAEDEERVAVALRASPLRVLDRRSEEGWLCLILAAAEECLPTPTGGADGYRTGFQNLERST